MVVNKAPSFGLNGFGACVCVRDVLECLISGTKVSCQPYTNSVGAMFAAEEGVGKILESHGRPPPPRCPFPF